MNTLAGCPGPGPVPGAARMLLHGSGHDAGVGRRAFTGDVAAAPQVRTSTRAEVSAHHRTARLAPATTPKPCPRRCPAPRPSRSSLSRPRPAARPAPASRATSFAAGQPNPGSDSRPNPERRNLHLDRTAMCPLYPFSTCRFSCLISSEPAVSCGPAGFSSICPLGFSHRFVIFFGAPLPGRERVAARR